LSRGRFCSFGAAGALAKTVPLPPREEALKVGSLLGFGGLEGDEDGSDKLGGHGDVHVLSPGWRARCLLTFCWISPRSDVQNRS
jgi:hypothetical protein